MMGTDPFLWTGIADRYPLPDVDPPFVIRSFADPDRIAYPVSPINEHDPAHHCIYI